MKKKTNICRVCLRLNRKLYSIDTKLLEFHDQLCEYSAYTLNPLYCKECEYLLRKTYNFKNKCTKAIQIFDSWKKSKQLNKSAEELCSQLPSSLAPWMLSDRTACINYVYNEECVESGTYGSDLDEAHGNTFNVIKLEIGCESDLKDTIKTEDIHNHITTNNGNNAGEENDIVMLDFTNNEESIKQENVILNEINYQQSRNAYTKDVENLELSLNEIIPNELNESDNDYLFINEDDDNFDSDDSLIPLSKTISTRKKTKGTIKKSLSKKGEKKKLKDKSDKPKRKKTKPEFSKERLRTELEAKFDAWGELKTEDGTVIDKELILNCLNDKITDDRMKQLWDSIQCKTPNPVTIRTFKHIMRNYTNEDLYSSVFTIHYLNTEEKMMEEVQRRKTYECYLTAKLKCEVCFLVFYKPKHLENHIKMHEREDYGLQPLLRDALQRDVKKGGSDTNKDLYTSVFTIHYLNTEEKMMEEVQRRKTYECYLTAKLKCEVCFLVFYKPKHLENHIKMHEENAGDFVCKICGLRFTSGKNLRGHLLLHSVTYKCKLCPLVTYYRDSMINHYNQHEGKSYTCENCGKTFKSLSAYKRHQYLSHRRGRHVCTTCGRAFVSELGVALHKKRMHQNEAPPPENTGGVHCTECDLSFPSEEVFLKHKRTWHLEHKPVKRTKRARPKNPKPPSIICRVCNAAGSIGWLTLHFRTEHPTLDMNVVYADKRKHLCHICAKGFWNATSLRYHLNSHTGVRPYACDHCPKRYHSGVALNEHRLRHFPPGKECTQCGKKFKTQSNLTNHMLFHTGTRRHKCSICGKAFLHSTSLNEHIRGVHYNMRRVKRGAPRGGKIGDAGISGAEMSD